MLTIRSKIRKIFNIVVLCIIVILLIVFGVNIAGNSNTFGNYINSVSSIINTDAAYKISYQEKENVKIKINKAEQTVEIIKEENDSFIHLYLDTANNNYYSYSYNFNLSNVIPNTGINEENISEKSSINTDLSPVLRPGTKDAYTYIYNDKIAVYDKNDKITYSGKIETNHEKEILDAAKALLDNLDNETSFAHLTTILEHVTVDIDFSSFKNSKVNYYENTKGIKTEIIFVSKDSGKRGRLVVKKVDDFSVDFEKIKERTSKNIYSINDQFNAKK